MKFTTEINATIKWLMTNEGYKRSAATKLAIKTHSLNVKKVREKLKSGIEFTFTFKKQDNTVTSRKAISLAEAIERGLYTPVEITEEKRAEQAQRRDARFPQGYVKFFDLGKQLPRMACAENVIGCEEI